MAAFVFSNVPSPLLHLAVHALEAQEASSTLLLPLPFPSRIVIDAYAA